MSLICNYDGNDSEGTLYRVELDDNIHIQQEGTILKSNACCFASILKLWFSFHSWDYFASLTPHSKQKSFALLHTKV